MDKGKKIIIGVAVAALTIGFIAVGALKSASGGDAVQVKTVKIEKGEISSYISASGIIKEVEKANVYFDTPMKVKKLLVQKNQKVTKGQKLVELDTESLSSELDKLKVNKEIQQLTLNSGVSASEVERSESALASAERAYSDSKKTYESNKDLYASKAISKSELDMSLKAVNESEAALKSARLALKTAKESKGVNKQTAEQNLKITNISINEIEKKITAINEAMLSPINGVIADTSLVEGSFTSSMQPAFTIINPDKLQVKANVREFDIKHVAEGQEVKISGEAIDKDKPVKGKVNSISPVAAITQTANGQETVIEVIIDIENSTGLKPGLSVDCDISTISNKGVILAPMDVFKEDKDGNKLVFVIDSKNNTMVETPVKLGISSDMNVEVTEGLKEGDIVVLGIQPTYKTGDKIEIIDYAK